MIETYLGVLTTLLIEIKRGIESENVLANNACLNKISVTMDNLKDKELKTLYFDLFARVSHLYKDRNSAIRKEYVKRTFSDIRGLLMQKILFDSESGLNI